MSSSSRKVIGTERSAVGSRIGSPAYHWSPEKSCTGSMKPTLNSLDIPNRRSSYMNDVSCPSSTLLGCWKYFNSTISTVIGVPATQLFHMMLFKSLFHMARVQRINVCLVLQVDSAIEPSAFKKHLSRFKSMEPCTLCWKQKQDIVTIDSKFVPMFCK